MGSDAAFLAGLLDRGEPAAVGAEDFAGPHGAALRHWQELGFVARAPVANPVPVCPHCGDGVPYRLGPRFLCPHCLSTVDARWLSLWPFHTAVFFRWLAGAMRLRGDCRRIDVVLWQLGTWAGGADRAEWFFRERGAVSDGGRTRLAAYRSVLVVFGLTPPPAGEHPSARFLSLLDLLPAEGPLAVTGVETVLRPRGAVRFDAHSGAFWVGDRLLGEVPPGSREFFFLACLAAHLDHFVPYADIKRDVLRQSGSTDGTEEATFCQNLKRRVKRAIPAIDRLIATTNKGDGYRLRRYAEW